MHRYTFALSTDKRVFKMRLNKLINFLEGNVLITGDFSARSNSTEDYYTSARIRAFEKVISNSSFCLLSNEFFQVPCRVESHSLCAWYHNYQTLSISTLVGDSGGRGLQQPLPTYAYSEQQDIPKLSFQNWAHPSPSQTLVLGDINIKK